MLSKPIFKYFFIFAVSFSTLIAALAISAYLLQNWCVALEVTLYAAVTYLIIKKFGYKRSVVFTLMLPLCILAWLHIIDFRATLFTLPQFFALLIGVISGIFLLKPYSKRIKWAYSFLLAFVTVWFVLYGYPLFLHKINFGTYTGIVSEPAPKFAFEDSVGHKYDKFEGITVLDFWTTRCGICFEKFPKLEKLHNEYKADPGIKIYAANLPIDDDKPLQAYNQISTRNYTFPVLKSAEPIDTTLKKFNFLYVPTVIILNSHNEIKYRGDIDGVEGVLKKLRENK